MEKNLSEKETARRRAIRSDNFTEACIVIARYMGAKIEEYKTRGLFSEMIVQRSIVFESAHGNPEGAGIYAETDLKYYREWSWLMPAVMEYMRKTGLESLGQTVNLLQDSIGIRIKSVASLCKALALRIENES